MRRLFSRCLTCLVLAVILPVALLLAGCGERVNTLSAGGKTRSGAVETVLETARLAEGSEDDGFVTLFGAAIRPETLTEITPQAWGKTGFRIVKDADTCLSVLLYEGGIYELGASFGGYGLMDACPVDPDGDGVWDLLYASSFGSGIHRTVLSVFDGKTKESTPLFSTFGSGSTDPDLSMADLMFTAVGDGAVAVSVCKVEWTDNDFAHLVLIPERAVGVISHNEGGYRFSLT